MGRKSLFGALCSVVKQLLKQAQVLRKQPQVEQQQVVAGVGAPGVSICICKGAKPLDVIQTSPGAPDAGAIFI